MTNKAEKYLSDVQTAIALIEKFLEGVDNFNTYLSDSKTQSAVERQFSKNICLF